MLESINMELETITNTLLICYPVKDTFEEDYNLFDFVK